jgi:hypothetical protein
MGSRQIVLVSTAGIFWREAKTKRLFSQCRVGCKVICKEGLPTSVYEEMRKYIAIYEYDFATNPY